MSLKRFDSRGFTLIEIAIVMVIIGLLAGGGVSMMGMLSERKTRNETIEYLNEARASLINFALINGRLPWADSDGDGDEDPSASSGSFPFQTLKSGPADPQRRSLRYALNSALGTGLSGTCSALRSGLSGSPLVVDSDGSSASFSVAAVLVSAGMKDADGDGNVFDDETTGTHLGDNRDGNPNYIRHVPDAGFDDLVVYLSEYTLYGEICGSPNLAVRNSTAGDIFVYDQTRGSDIGIVTAGSTISYGITAGDRIQLRSAAGGGGSIVASTPMTPIVVAGEGVTVVAP